MTRNTFFIANEDEIRDGKTTDVYFLRTQTIIQKESKNYEVCVEITASSASSNYSNWGVVAGVEDVIDLLSGSEVDLYALPEGTVFTQRDVNGVKTPVLVIVGKYLEFSKFETPLLGFLCSKSGMTTSSVRIRRAAGFSHEKIILSFGARRAHPAITPVVSYCAYIGGCDGISCLLGAEKLNLTPTGTIPHSLIILFQDQVKAWKAFDEHIDPSVPRVALIDTYFDEKKEAIMAAEAIPNLFGIRLDTPKSRKGDFRAIIQEIRWELDIRGFDKVKIFISGGIGEKDVKELQDVVDGFGVGSAISAAPPIDFALDIVSLKRLSGEWLPVAKRGKFSGRKQVARCDKCFQTQIIPWESDPPFCSRCQNEMSLKLIKFLENGKRIHKKPAIQDIRDNIRKQLMIVDQHPNDFS
ncbi:MAG: nicotinate phosphoribosyltransferase [Candidatus Hodarchaeales archaeon]|jgi:nicotinate phosphoribosyltransferase